MLRRRPKRQDDAAAFKRQLEAVAELGIVVAEHESKEEREREARARFSQALEDRSGGICEASNVCDSFGRRICGRAGRHEGADPHHVWPEDRDAGLHDPARGKWLCRVAHRYVHAFPHEGSRLGLLRPPDRAVR